VTVLMLSPIGAVLGDQTGYVVGRWGGRRLMRRVSKLSYSL
jgi:membrane protein DedA with SNARE-associated domain